MDEPPLHGVPSSDHSAPEPRPETPSLPVRRRRTGRRTKGWGSHGIAGVPTALRQAWPAQPAGPGNAPSQPHFPDVLRGCELEFLGLKKYTCQNYRSYSPNFSVIDSKPALKITQVTDLSSWPEGQASFSALGGGGHTTCFPVHFLIFKHFSAKSETKSTFWAAKAVTRMESIQAAVDAGAARCLPRALGPHGQGSGPRTHSGQGSRTSVHWPHRPSQPRRKRAPVRGSGLPSAH